jgi:esterase/lipase superfamily enzyme
MENDPVKEFEELGGMDTLISLMRAGRIAVAIVGVLHKMSEMDPKLRAAMSIATQRALVQETLRQLRERDKKGEGKED